MGFLCNFHVALLRQELFYQKTGLHVGNKKSLAADVRPWSISVLWLEAVQSRSSIVFREWPTSCIRGNSSWSCVGCWPDIFIYILQSAHSCVGTRRSNVDVCCRGRVAHANFPSFTRDIFIHLFHSAYACGGICVGMDPVYRDRYIPSQKRSKSIVDKVSE